MTRNKQVRMRISPSYELLASSHCVIIAKLLFRKSNLRLRNFLLKIQTFNRFPSPHVNISRAQQALLKAKQAAALQAHTSQQFFSHLCFASQTFYISHKQLVLSYSRFAFMSCHGRPADVLADSLTTGEFFGEIARFLLLVWIYSI